MSYQDPNQPNQYGGGYSAPQPNPSGEQPPYGQQQQPPYGQQQQPPYGQQQPPYGQQQQPPYGQQQPPYGQQQAPYGQQQYGLGGSNDTSIGMKENIAILVSYAFWWISGLIVFFTEKKNRLVRVHAMQSILVFGATSIVIYILDQLSWSSYGLYTIFSLLSDLVSLGAFVLWVFLLVNAWQGRYFKLPIVGDYAERFTK